MLRSCKGCPRRICAYSTVLVCFQAWHSHPLPPGAVTGCDSRCRGSTPSHPRVVGQPARACPCPRTMHKAVTTLSLGAYAPRGSVHTFCRCSTETLGCAALVGGRPQGGSGPYGVISGSPWVGPAIDSITLPKCQDMHLGAHAPGGGLNRDCRIYFCCLNHPTNFKKISREIYSKKT